MKHWERISLPWYEPNVKHCQFCGQMIPRDVWVVEEGEICRIFCNPECEQLFSEFWLPMHGGNTPKGSAP